MKICSGVIKSDDTIYDVDKENEEKISKLYILRGNKPDRGERNCMQAISVPLPS